MSAPAESPSIVLAVRAGDQWRVYPCGPVGPPTLRPHPLPTVVQSGPATDVLPRIRAAAAARVPAPIPIPARLGPPVEVTRLLPKLSARPLPVPAAPHAAAARAPQPATPPLRPVQAVLPPAIPTPPPAAAQPSPTGRSTGKHRRPGRRITLWRRTPATPPA